jgi:hypothetical protein
MTSAPGAFGYFADSRAELTPEAILQEQYYIAAQTLYLSEWNENWVELKPWYKFRKMLVVNPTNGKAVVAVVGDAGPAWFTGKQFGGSPEVMNFLQLKDGAQKKRVVILFVDEQRASNEIPLGPVKYQ